MNQPRINQAAAALIEYCVWMQCKEAGNIELQSLFVSMMLGDGEKHSETYGGVR
jgi:hypothetical protein